MCRYGAAFHGATHARRDTFHCLLHSSRPFLSSSVFLARSPANNRPWRNGAGHPGPYPATFLSLPLPPRSAAPSTRPSTSCSPPPPPPPLLLLFLVLLLPVLALPFFSLHSTLLLFCSLYFFVVYTRLRSLRSLARPLRSMILLPNWSSPRPSKSVTVFHSPLFSNLSFLLLNVSSSRFALIQSSAFRYEQEKFRKRNQV